MKAELTQTSQPPEPGPAGGGRGRESARFGFSAVESRIALGLGAPVLAFLLSALPALACRYNVRDVGFVDLETESYRLNIFVPPSTPEAALARLQQLTGDALRDCNVECELVTASQATNHPALRHLPHSTTDTLAGVVLVSPDGQTLHLPLSGADDSLSRRTGEGRGEGSDSLSRRTREGWGEGSTIEQSLAAVLREVASSPKRDELLTAVTRGFAAVLLIEGEAADANRRARQAILDGIEAIRRQMPSLPKTITTPPELVVLEAAALAEERILLWSLGLDTTATVQPRAAIVYGRARWMGPLMQGEEISEPNVTGLLSIIGADCECGLDVAWTLGTRLPVRWDEARHVQVAKALGFDPENPLVKIEVGRIAGRSSGRRPAPSAAQPAVLSSDPSPNAGPAPTTRSANDTHPVLIRGWLFLAGLAVVVLGTGGYLLWSAARRG